jgi:hypothetical protein
MPAHRLQGTVLVALALAGCGGGAEPPPPTPVRHQAALLPRGDEPAEDPATRRDRFCRALGRIIDAEPDGFAGLRAARAGEGVWDGSVVPPGLDDCRIEGDDRPGARYVCHGGALAGGSADLLAESYDDVVADIDGCLVQPIWYPHDWQRGQEFTFAGGERRVLWRDRAMGAGTANVALNVEEDLTRRLWTLRLAVGTER